VAKGEYLARSYVDPNAPAIGLERIKQGYGARDERLNRAVTEVLQKGRVPLPDRFFPGPVHVATDRLALDYGGCASRRARPESTGWCWAAPRGRAAPWAPSSPSACRSRPSATGTMAWCAGCTAKTCSTCSCRAAR